MDGSRIEWQGRYLKQNTQLFWKRQKLFSRDMEHMENENSEIMEKGKNQSTDIAFVYCQARER